MAFQHRGLGIIIGVGLVLHGLGHAVLPMRAADVVASQKYNGFPVTNIRNGGQFHGAVLEGVVAF